MKKEIAELVKLLIETEKDINHNITIENYDRATAFVDQSIRLKEEINLLALINCK
jgi:hypothetical protein